MTWLVDKLDKYRIYSLPNNGHRNVRLGRNCPPVRIDMHGELVKVFKDPE